MDLSGVRIGYGITGSFCTFSKTKEAMKELKKLDATILPVFSYMAASTDTRFAEAQSFQQEIINIAGNNPITTIVDAEPVGPKKLFDVMVIAPCTGNTIAKLANGIVDTPVLMAAKAHMRNLRPLVLAVSTNDAMGANFKNIGLLMNTKNIYFVPFAQDDSERKPNSLVADLTHMPATIEAALQGRQLQPVLR